MIDEKRLINDLKLLIKRSFLGEATAQSEISIGEITTLINNQPQVNNWIPCSDGKNLPNKMHNVKWDYTTNRGDDKGCSVLVTIKGGFVKETIFWKYMNDFNEDDVIAWQPLPEPYREITEFKVEAMTDREMFKSLLLRLDIKFTEEKDAILIDDDHIDHYPGDFGKSLSILFDDNGCFMVFSPWGE